MNTQEQIAFQNGFVVGTSIKQLLPMGTAYNPDVWNDEGEYSYFYIDFKQPVEDFSLGMASESISVLASGLRNIIGVEKINSMRYKMNCNISDSKQGVRVIGKAGSEIRYLNGKSILEFASFFFVAGQTSLVSAPYLYEKVKFPTELELRSIEQYKFSMYAMLQIKYTEIAQYTTELLDTQDTINITFI